MEQCIKLWKETENAIRQELLKDFIAQQADCRQKNRKKGDAEYCHKKTSQQSQSNVNE